MDGLTLPNEGHVTGLRPSRQTRGMPPEAPVGMPEQRLYRFHKSERRAFISPERSVSRRWPRIAVLGGAFIIAATGVYEMTASLAVGGISPIEGIVIFLFALNIAWIALTFVSAAAGAIVTMRRGRPVRDDRPVIGRTAVLMPTYNENPERVFAAIEAMADGVHRLGKTASFDWFVLSDTTDAAIALAEETAFVELRARRSPDLPLYYRRRHRNIGRKTGNIADFCRRWSGAYDYLIVLDADSLMEPTTIVELARRMDEDPDAGLIQTVPRLVQGKTVFARLQQFAGRAYGPVIASGLAWWTGSEGNYWGHNAILRREAFTSAAGLPKLSGGPPFGGHILSHDFVEAALIRRAGWTVRIADDLAGSYEEPPPSIIDFATRDRRWCQGNLQHAKIVGARGLHWVSRFHMLSGIVSYAASVLWLLLIVAGLALAVQAQFTPPDYFQEPYQLFPTWPQIDSVRELRLLAFTVLLLLGPKLFGLGLMMFDRKARRTSGGVFGLLASFLFELFLSVLIAPIMMMIQTGVIVSILRGKDSGWKPQRRDGSGFALSDVWRRHRWHMAAGVLLAACAYAVSPITLAWLSPAVLGLLLAVPVSAATGSSAIGIVVHRLGLLRTPEESVKPRINRAALNQRPVHRTTLSSTPDIRGLVRNDSWRKLHLALLDAGAKRAPGEVDPVEAVAAAKIGEAHSLDEALSYLGPEEQAATLASPKLFARLSALGETPPRLASEVEPEPTAA